MRWVPPWDSSDPGKTMEAQSGHAFCLPGEQVTFSLVRHCSPGDMLSIHCPPLHAHWEGCNKKTVTRIGMDVQKLAPQYIASGNVKLCHNIWKKFWQFLNQLNIELPHDSAAYPRYILKKNEDLDPYSNLYINVQRSIIYKSQKWKQPKDHQLIDG